MDPLGIEIRPLASREEFQACVMLQRDTWGSDFTDVVPVSILKVSQRVGGVSAGAFSRQGELLGFVFGMTGIERGKVVHWSDMLAVKTDARNLGLGRRLKEYQRNAVREMGGLVIYWTYDPLIARNAHLNFNRLGVRLAEYVEDMYGITDSPLHGGIATDRMVVAWPTRSEEIDERVAQAGRVIGSGDCRGAPIVNDAWIAGAAGASILPHCLRVEVPSDAETLLHSDPAAAGRWRLKLRRALQWCLAAGYTVSAFDVDGESLHGYYIMVKTARPSLGVSRQ